MVMLVVFACDAVASSSATSVSLGCRAIFEPKIRALLFPAFDHVDSARLEISDYLQYEPSITLLDSGEAVLTLAGSDKEVLRGLKRLETRGYVFELLNDEEVLELQSAGLLRPAPLAPKRVEPLPTTPLQPLTQEATAQPLPVEPPPQKRARSKPTHELRLLGNISTLPEDTETVRNLGLIVHQVRVVQEPLEGKITSLTVIEIELQDMSRFPRLTTLPRFVSATRVVSKQKPRSP